ncbi:hypothetical protein [Myxococcus sp. RHSTA-1-4]|uniref:hypothetical protein n=1 Tax=Myxococcus sp. RHSTA-1-4 TaxID=2874601 RepID=UPI001CBCD961|nr:hypothetical protein [Myxococcus sp. RHSTA-1-4]MBZ4422662.1 hypothetical protein [Myxococcus sp. RHSTA-1-4]
MLAMAPIDVPTLKARISSALASSPFQVSGTGLQSEPLTRLLVSHLGADSLALDGASRTAETDTSITVSGKLAKPYRGLSGLQAVATFTVADGVAHLSLRLTGLPSGWKPSDTFSALKGTHFDLFSYAAPELGLASSGAPVLPSDFAARFGFVPASLTLQEKQVPGLSLKATLSPLPALKDLSWLMGGGSRWDVTGAIVLNGELPSLCLRSAPQAPLRLAGYDIPFALSLASAPVEPKDGKPPSFVTSCVRLEAAVSKDVGAAQPLRIPLAVRLHSRELDVLTIESELSPGQGLSFSQLPHLLGGESLAGLVPDSLPALDDLQLRGLSLSVAPRSQKLVSLGVTVAYSQPDPWEVLDGLLTFEQLAVTFTYFPSGSSRVTAEVECLATLGGDLLNASIELPSLGFACELLPGSTVDIAEAVKSIAGDSISMGQMRCTELKLFGNVSSREYRLQGTLTDDWSFSLGSTPLVLTGISLDLDYAPGRGGAGEVVGNFSIAGTELMVAAEYEGTGLGWTFSGGTVGEQNISLTTLMSEALDLFGLSLPANAPEMTLRNLNLSFNTASRSFSLRALSATELLGTTLDLGVELGMSRTVEGASTKTFRGYLWLAGNAFMLDYLNTPQTKTLHATWMLQDPKERLGVDDLARALGLTPPALPGDLDVGLTSASLTYTSASSTTPGTGAGSPQGTAQSQLRVQGTLGASWKLRFGGGAPVELRNITVGLDSGPTRQLTGRFGGTLEVLGAKTTFQLAVPGSFRVAASLPRFEVDLPAIISDLAGSGFDLPDWFPSFTLPQTELFVEQRTDAGASTFSFGLYARPEALGVIALQVLRTNGKWGFAAGLNLDMLRMSDIPGLDVLAPFDEVFQFEKLLLAVATHTLPGYTFPDSKTLANPTLQASPVTLPAQAGGQLQEGFNLYSRMRFGGDETANILRKFLGVPVDGTLDISLQIGRDPKKNSRLSAAVACDIDKNTRLTGSFGAMMEGGVFGLFLNGLVTTKVEGQPLTFDVKMSAVPLGVYLTGTMRGTLSFSSVKLTNLALMVGINTQAIPTLGIAATVDVASFNSSIAVLFDSVNPGRSMFAGAVSELTLHDVVTTIAGAPVPSVMSKVLTGFGLHGTRTFQLPDSVAAALDSRDLATVADAFQQHGQVRIPSGHQSVLLTVNARGRAWHLTDLTTMTHYELKRDGTNIRVSLQPQIYCAPQATTIGALSFPMGFQVHGGLEFFGLRAETDVIVNPMKGIAVDVDVEPLIIGKREFLSITGYKGKSHPRLSLSTFTQPQLEADFREPHAFLSAGVKLLGLEVAGLLISISDQGFAFGLTERPSTTLSYELKARFKDPSDFTCGGRAEAGIDTTLDLGALGTLRLETRVDGKLDLGYSGGKLWARCTGEFRFQGQRFNIATFDLAIKDDTLLALGKDLQDKAEALVRKFLEQGTAWLEWVRQGAILGFETAEAVADVLMNQFRQTPEAAARGLRLLNHTGAEAAQALETIYGIGGDAAGVAMKAAGYSSKQIATGLRTAYGWSATHTARFMKDTLKYGDDTVKAALDAAGYADKEIKKAMKTVFDWFKDLFDL